MKNTNLEYLKEMVIHILNKTNGLDYYKLFKVLYFAEMEHLAKWGVPMIEEDEFCALEHGPVPSRLFNAVKGLDLLSNCDARYIHDSVKFVGPEAPYVLIATREPNMDYLSRSNIEALDKSIDENAHLSFNELKEKSHDEAWKEAWDKNEGRRVMSILSIAKVKIVEDYILEYLEENLLMRSVLG